MPNVPYKLSFTTGGLFASESVIVAKICEDVSGKYDQAASQALQNTLSLPKTSSRQRTIREILKRLATLSEAELEFLRSSDRSEAQMLIWLATCRAYRFVHEYSVEVVCERYAAMRFDLPLESFDAFFESRTLRDPNLETIRPSTRRKLRQVLFRMMREASIVTDDNRIQGTVISPPLMRMLEQSRKDSLAVFPGH